MAGHHSRYKTLLNSSDFPSVVRLLHFTGSELSIICSLMTTLKSCINLSDIGSLEIQGASLGTLVTFLVSKHFIV
ncbi:hypothetical protein, partial [Escherichia coli]